jgi:hypothetical protein
VPQRCIAGGSEVVAPGELEDQRREFAGDLACLVVRAGIDDHDLVKQPRDRCQAPCQLMRFVANDLAERDRQRTRHRRSQNGHAKRNRHAGSKYARATAWGGKMTRHVALIARLVAKRFSGGKEL